VNDGGNINLVAGQNMIITPDNSAKTITISTNVIEVAFGYGESIEPLDGYELTLAGGFKHYTFYLNVAQSGNQDGHMHLPLNSTNGNCIILVYESNSSNDDLTIYSGPTETEVLISGIDSSNQYMFVFISGEWKYVGAL
jgi:hypothetical protein